MASPKHPSLDPSAPAEPPTEPTKKGFTEQLGDDAFDHLRRYQVITMPPGARAELMAAQLPLEPPELLEDTVPPNRGVTAPRGPSSSAPTVVEDDEAKEGPTGRKARQRRLQGLVVGVSAGMALLAVLALTGQSRQPTEYPSAAKPSPGAPLASPPAGIDSPTPALSTNGHRPLSRTEEAALAASSPAVVGSAAASGQIVTASPPAVQPAEKATPARKSATASASAPKDKPSPPTTSVFDSAFVPPAN
ncbi:MAG TPA: hypothetical protein VJN18_05300 [Polyangiaceae bacterium]|nr:hypothetical protein [Polyangiaceae bacterium]